MRAFAFTFENVLTAHSLLTLVDFEAELELKGGNYTSGILYCTYDDIKYISRCVGFSVRAALYI